MFKMLCYRHFIDALTHNFIILNEFFITKEEVKEMGNKFCINGKGFVWGRKYL